MSSRTHDDIAAASAHRTRAWLADAHLLPVHAKMSQRLAETIPARIERDYDTSPDYYEQLGEGSFGVVFRARRRSDGVDVAIKEVLEDIGASSDDIAHEIAVLRRINQRGGHPNVVVYYGSFEARRWLSSSKAEDTAYLVTQYIPGTPLSNWVRRKRGTARQVRRLLRTAMEGLVFLHDVANVAHRDVRPDNIVVRTVGDDVDSVIIDIGLACLLDERGNCTSKPGSGQRSVDLYETFYRQVSASNERAELLKASDVWAMGVSFWEAVQGGKFLEDILPDIENRDVELAIKRIFTQKKTARRFNAALRESMTTDAARAADPIVRLSVLEILTLDVSSTVVVDDKQQQAFAMNEKRAHDVLVLMRNAETALGLVEKE